MELIKSLKMKIVLIIIICILSAALPYALDFYPAYLPEFTLRPLAAALNEDIRDLNEDISYLNKDVNDPGSGSSGGGTSGEAFENIMVSETRREFVNKDSNVSYSFNFEGNIVRFINFTALKSSGQITSKVEILEHTSSLAGTAPPDIVYKNLNIWVGNLGWANSNIADPRVNFKVERSWVVINNIDESTIVLNRYSGGKWNALETAVMGKDDIYLYFEAQTPSFSPFSVTGKKLSEGEGSGEHIASPAASMPGAASGPENTDTPGFGGLLSSICILLVFILILQKKDP